MRKIFSLFVALTAVVSLSAKTIYLNTASSDWAEADAVTFVHAWGGAETTTNVQMTPVENHPAVLSIDLPDDQTSMLFVRMAPGSTEINWEENWGKTVDLDIPEDKNQFTVIGWTESVAYGMWLQFDVLPMVAIVGSFGEGTWGPVYVMTPADDLASAGVTIENLPAGTYEMKVWVDGYYLSLNGEGESLFRIHRDWNHADHVNLINDGRNFEFVADVTGNYAFTWTYATLDLVVTFPTAAGIENANANTKAVKCIVNGQLRILRDSKTFNALGAEVK